MKIFSMNIIYMEVKGRLCKLVRLVATVNPIMLAVPLYWRD